MGEILMKEKIEMKGLLAYIYKSDLGASDNGNFSSKFSRVIILPSSMFPKIPQVFSVMNDCPAVMIFSRRLFSNEPDYLTAYPVDADGVADMNCMFGGTFIHTSDSRFPFNYPIPLHDRKE